MDRFISVPKRYLLLISGVMWSGVGLMLIFRATAWLHHLDHNHPWLIILMGAIPGIFIALFGFSLIVRQNIIRIEGMDPLVSVFAFQAWHSYVLIIIMVSMGVLVRHFSWIPLILKTPTYYAIGIALSISSIRYYQDFLISPKIP